MTRTTLNSGKAFLAALLLAVVDVPAQREPIGVYIESMEALTQLLIGVRDVASGKTAQPKLEAAISHYIEMRDQVRKLSFEQRKDRNKEMQETYIRMTDELRRVRANAAIEKELHATLARLE